MSAPIDYTLNASQNGGKILGFSYTRTLNDLVGTWSAEMQGGSYKAGDDFSVDGFMKNGIIVSAFKDPDGMWHLSGKDAGVRLMRIIPGMPRKNETSGVVSYSNGGKYSGAGSSDITSTMGVIRDLAGDMLSQTVSGSGLSGFNAYSLVSGGTCADAILELALLGGQIAYIDSDGKLVVKEPKQHDVDFSKTKILDDSGSELDLDGYATDAYITLTCLKEPEKIEDDEDEDDGGVVTRIPYWTGKEAATTTTEETKKWEFEYPDNTGWNMSDGTMEAATVSGSVEVTVIQPMGIISRLVKTITRKNVTVTSTEDYSYRGPYSVSEMHNNQEFVYWAWCESGRTVTKETSGYYEKPVTVTQNNRDEHEGSTIGDTVMKQIPFYKRTIENTTREFDLSAPPWVPQRWSMTARKLKSENYLRQTESMDAPDKPTEKKEDMPAYDPAYDIKIETIYSSLEYGMASVCNETEHKFENRHMGDASLVWKNKNAVKTKTNRLLAVTVHSVPEWVDIITHRTYYERYNPDGTCSLSTKSEWCDNGAEWYFMNHKTATTDEQVEKDKDNYAKFSSIVSSLDVSLGGSTRALGNWQFTEFEGRKLVYKVTGDDGKETDVSQEDALSDWFVNGNYASSKVCPHYNEASGKCGIFGIAALGDSNKKDTCNRNQGRNSWPNCRRAVAALEERRRRGKGGTTSAPVLGIAHHVKDGTDSTMAFVRELYIDKVLDEETAKGIADTAARNVLKVKWTKGYLRTVIIPLDTKNTFELDGTITSISHDLFNMRTTIKYRVEGQMQPFMIPASAAGVAATLVLRGENRRLRPMTGRVYTIDKDENITVMVNGIPYPCSTNLVNIAVGDGVLVQFQSGNSVRGQIIEKL